MANRQVRARADQVSRLTIQELALLGQTVGQGGDDDQTKGLPAPRGPPAQGRNGFDAEVVDLAGRVGAYGLPRDRLVLTNLLGAAQAITMTPWTTPGGATHLLRHVIDSGVPRIRPIRVTSRGKPRSNVPLANRPSTVNHKGRSVGCRSRCR